MRTLPTHRHRTAGRRALSMAAQPVLAALLAACVHTAPFRTPDGTPLPGSVAAMEFIRLGGVEQRVWVRGVDRRQPILVVLHGGPGASEGALFGHYDADLERRFVVVQWEQRGTGRSYHADMAPGSMTVAQLLADLDQLVDTLRRRYGQQRVVVLGHSWGTVLGTLYAHRCPAKVAAYVGTGQIANKREGDRLALGFALAQARQRNDARAIEALQAIDIEHPGVDDLFTLGRWVERYGGAFHADLSTGRLLWTALRSDEMGLLDLLLFGIGNRYSHERLLDEFRRVDLTAMRRFDVPVTLLLGRHDRVTPSVLAQAWFDSLDAPAKRLLWFEGSAHNVPFEQPQEFVRAMVEQVAVDALRSAGSQRCAL